MSAIAGIFHFDGAAAEPSHIDAMTTAMRLRGPDGRASWAEHNAALGHCMLHVTAESLQETQPWANEDRTLLLVYDGRLDEPELLRRQLLAGNAVLRNHSDAELMLRAYATWGSDCVQHLHGDFALLLWDKHNQRVFCARDRMGTKPLQYWWNGKTLCVASTLDALLALPFVPKLPNQGYLADLLLDVITCDDETLWQGLWRLPPAHVLQVNAERCSKVRYWQPDVWQRIRYRRLEEYHEHYRELLANVVRRKSRSHRPLACEVSGGLDSSAVFSMASHLERQGNLPAPAIRAYTLAFVDDAAANEIAYARAVGAHWQSSIAEIAPESRATAWYQELAARWGDFPNFPNGVMSLGLYQRAVDDRCRVIMSGWGGDYWLDGSRSYYADLLQERQWRQWLDCMMTDGRAFGPVTALRWALGYGLLPLLPFGLRSWLRRQLTTVAGLHQREHGFWLAPSLQQLGRQRRERFRVNVPQQVARVGQRGQLNLLADYGFLHAHEQTERLVAEQGLEVANPLGDPDIVQFAFATPEYVRRCGRVGRACHRAALKGILPDLVAERMDKAEFNSTFLYHLPRMADLLMREIPARHPDWVSGKGMAELFAMITKPENSEDPGWTLWALVGCDKVYDRYQ